jgi:hypothetical protein
MAAIGSRWSLPEWLAQRRRRQTNTAVSVNAANMHTA